MNVQFLYAGALVLIAVTMALLYILKQRAGSWRPKDPVHWTGYVLAMGVLLCCVGVIALGSKENFDIERHAIAGPDEILEMELNNPADNFEFKMVSDNRPTTFDSFKGDVVLLNLWATWCAPCLVEIPELNKLQKEFGDQGLTIISVSDEDRQTLIEFEQSFQLETTSGYVEIADRLPDYVIAGFDIRPTSYVIDRNGIARKYILGARDYAYFKKAIEPYL